MSVTMYQATPPSNEVQVLQPEEKLSREEVARLLEEEGGPSALIVLLRNDKVETDTVISALTRFRDRPRSLLKRILIAIVENVLH